MYFSSLAGESTTPTNPLYVMRREIEESGRPVGDLVSGNPSEHGIVYPQDELAAALQEAAARARIYRPDPLGQPAAREAIARYYAGLSVAPDRVVVTPGTSVSYWYLFRLLAEPGDEILCPQPSYPLFDHIARIAGVELGSYRLLESRRWAMDLDYLEHRITTRTRAVVLISPHNPTGMVADEAQLEGLAAIAARHSLPIIADEVFSEFLFGLDRLPRPAATAAPLVFTLNGFSKMFALPGMKIGWIAVTGEETLVRRAIGALELFSDTFLPVNEVAQFAVPGIFQRGQAFLAQYVGWVRDCREIALRALSGLSLVEPRGGFYLTLEVDRDEEEAAEHLLREEGLFVHPGYFYDMAPNHLVMTFIHSLPVLADLLARLTKHIR